MNPISPFTTAVERSYSDEISGQESDRGCDMPSRSQNGGAIATADKRTLSNCPEGKLGVHLLHATHSP